MIGVTNSARGRHARLALAVWRKQVELLGPAYRRAAAVHPELAVDVPGVGPHGAQRDREMAGDFRGVQFGAEQPEHVELAFAERFDRRSVCRRVCRE